MSEEKIVGFPQRKMRWPGRLLSLTLTTKGRPIFLGVLLGSMILASLLGGIMWELVVGVFFLGFILGGLAGWEEGMSDKDQIINETIGEHWFEDACKGKFEREAKETAPWN